MEYIDWDLAERSIVGVETFDKDSSWNSELVLAIMRTSLTIEFSGQLFELHCSCL